MCCVTGINLWGNSSVLLNCRFNGPVRGYTHTWKSTGGLFSRYWMGKAVSVNARLSETFFFCCCNFVIMKHFWSGGQEMESAIYPRCQNSQPVANGVTTFCYSNLRSGVISFVCFFTSLTQEWKNSSSRKQITEIRGEGMITGYCYSCSQFLPTPPPINNY